MSNIWKIAISLTLVLCLAVAFIACGDDEPGELYITDDEGQTRRVVYVTDEAGDTILGEDGEPLTEFATESETFAIPVTDGDEGGEAYGELVTPSNKK